MMTLPAVRLSAAQAAADLVPLSREFGRLSALLQARRGQSEPDELDELEQRRRRKALEAPVRRSLRQPSSGISKDGSYGTLVTCRRLGVPPCPADPLRVTGV
jgi:hypothetical protein